LTRGRAWGEEDLVRRIERVFPGSDRQVVVPIGDDAAVLRVPAASSLVATTDQMVEGIHFRRADRPGRLLGDKALCVNLSDLAAMGATPRWALLSLFLPPHLRRRDLLEILRGMAGRARKCRVSLIGGNITASSVLALDLTLLGLLPRGITPLRRRGARAGDSILISGSLGASALGLRLLGSGWRWREGAAFKRGASPEKIRAATRVLRRHLSPEPELALGSLLARHGLASAAMDVSDGLSQDLHRLCRASGVGARVELSSLPLDPGAMALAGNEDALRLALHGGEDYLLLVTVPPSRMSALKRLLPRGRLRPIGRVVPQGDGISLVDSAGKERPMPAFGYDHLHPTRAIRVLRTP
jgi:thiamine-monophosphate kinase